MSYLELYKCSTDHFEPWLKNKARRKYLQIIKACPICGQNFETQKGHPKEKITCSSKCSNTYFSASKHSIEANKKRSTALINHYGLDKTLSRIRVSNKSYVLYKKQCKLCNEDFSSLNKKQLYCSNSCASKAKILSSP